jgi:hypothetical protein
MGKPGAAYTGRDFPQWAGPRREVRRTWSAKTTHGGVALDQVLQVIGALLVLSGFALAQFRLLDQRSYAYLALNLVGSAVLAVLAWRERQWGFLLLEGAWALISLWGVAARWLGRDVAASH